MSYDPRTLMTGMLYTRYNDAVFWDRRLVDTVEFRLPTSLFELISTMGRIRMLLHNKTIFISYWIVNKNYNQPLAPAFIQVIRTW